MSEPPDTRSRGDHRAIPVRHTGSKPPLFLVHDESGSVEYARVLHPHIDAEIPVYALPPASASEPQLRTVEGMARRLARMIREVQPAGPYRLAGRSFGGILASEVATQLIGEDEVVEFVGMMEIDSPADTGSGAGRAGCVGEAQAPPLGTPVRVSSTPGTHLSTGDADDVARLGDALSREIGLAAGKREPLPEDGYSSLVTLRFGKAGGIPLFCVPGAGANVASFTDLVGYLDPARPVHAFQPRGVDGDMVPHSTVPAAAAAYLRILDEIQPTGPVHLLGHSFGGWVVFEMALRLRRAGRTVGFLTLLDSEVPDEDGAHIGEYDSREAFLELVRVFEMATERPMGIDPGEIDSLDEAGRLGVLHERLVRFGRMPRRSTPEVLRGPFRTFSACLRTPYTPAETYPDPLRLVLVSDGRERFAETVRGWKRWAPSLAFSVGAGNHMTALKRPYVRDLASHLAADVLIEPG